MIIIKLFRTDGIWTWIVQNMLLLRDEVSVIARGTSDSFCDAAIAAEESYRVAVLNIETDFAVATSRGKR